VNFRGERLGEPPQFGGIFGQIGSGARHGFVYYETRIGAARECMDAIRRPGVPALLA
jgi:hypothetical protein